MRVIGGTSKGKKLATPKGRGLRPTSDRVKESLFNILGETVKGKRVLDLYAGTGNLGIEALSRGAQKVFFVERGREGTRLIRNNLAQCGLSIYSELISKDVLRAIGILHQRGERFDLILMDPPYERGLIEQTLRKLLSHRIYHEGSLLVIEHDRREPLPSNLSGWSVLRQRRIGDTILSFLKPLPSFPTGEPKGEG